jgi:hypothetical protein
MAMKGKQMAGVWSAIKNVCKRLGFDAKRVDENPGAGLIIKEIAELIRRAQFVFFDLTHERPNVYYELGYAHGLGNNERNTLLVAMRGTKLHFDIAGLRVHHYGSTKELRSIIRQNLPAMPGPIADKPRASRRRGRRARRGR